MANEHLRSGLARAGVEVEDLAAELGVDAKTVQRWLGGRVPHGRHRARIAAVLERDAHELWPDVAPAGGPGDDRQDLAGVYAHAGDVRVADWRTLLTGARARIDLLDFTLTDLLATPGTVDRLTEKARSGVAVRVLVSHPKSLWMTSWAEQRGDSDVDDAGDSAMDRQLTQSLKLLAPLAALDGVEVRTFWAERTLSVLRFDEQMLVTHHLYATPDRDAPLLHLHRHADGGLFDRFVEHVQRIVEQASEPVPVDLLIPR